MMDYFKGIFFTVLASFIYGITPILIKVSFLEGSNPVTLCFLLPFLSIIVLYGILKFQKIPLTVDNKTLCHILVMSLVGYAPTSLLLYSSYDYIAVGMASTIHFAYPAVVAFFCAVIFKERFTLVKMLALFLCSAGIISFFEGDFSGGLIGIAIAFISSVTYAFYIVYIDKTSLKDMYPLKLSFFMCIASAAAMLAYGVFTAKLTFDLTPKAYVYSFAVSILVSVFAITLMQMGIRHLGSTVSSIICTVEPITSVILGILLLKEPCTFNVVLGCILVISAVTILAVSNAKNAQ